MAHKREVYNLEYYIEDGETLEELADRIIKDIKKNFKINKTKKQYPTNELSTITKITFYDKLKVDANDLIQGLVIEVNNEPFIILDISYGLSISLLDMITNEIKDNKSRSFTIYEIDNNDFQSDIKFGEVNKVLLYRKAELVNKINGKTLCKSDVVELTDYNNNKFYVDYFNNNIYKRENIYKINKHGKIITIFDRHKLNSVNVKMFDSLTYKLTKITKNLEI